MDRGTMRWTRPVRRARQPARGVAAAAQVQGSSGDSLPSISVVVPVHNVERYLLDAVRSVQRQTYRDLQIILVDDGSTDRSGSICDEIAAEDERVMVIHQPNGGLSHARNVGLAAATGEFVAFADSDDLVHPTAYERMLSTLMVSESEFATGNVRRFNSTRNWQAWNQRESHRRRRLRTNLAQHPELVYDTVVWNKLFRRTFIDRIDLAFPVGRLYEDMAPMSRAYVLAESVDVLPQPVYSWRERDEGGSITQRRNELPNMQAKLEAIAEMHQILRADRETSISDHLFLKLFHGDLWVFARHVGDADEAYCDLFTEVVRTYWARTSEQLRNRIHDGHRLFFSSTVAFGAATAADIYAWFLASGTERLTDVRSGELVLSSANYPSRLPPLSRPSRTLISGSQVKHKLTAMRWRGNVLEIEGWAYVPYTVDAGQQTLEISALNVADGTRVELPHSRRTDHSVDVLAKDAMRTYADSAFTAVLDLDDPHVAEAMSSGRWVLVATVVAGEVKRSTELVEQDRNGTLRTVAAHEVGAGLVVDPLVEPRQPVTLVLRRPKVRATRVQLSHRRLTVDLSSTLTSPLVAAWLDHPHPVERSEATLTQRITRGYRLRVDVPPPTTRGNLVRGLKVRTAAGRVLPVDLPEHLVTAQDDVTTSVMRTRRGMIAVSDERSSATIEALDVVSATRVRLSGTTPGSRLQLAVHRAENQPSAWKDLEVDGSRFSTTVDLGFTDWYGRRRPLPAGRYSLTLRDAETKEPWTLRTALPIVETYPIQRDDFDAHLTVKATTTGRLSLILDAPVPEPDRSVYSRRQSRIAFGEDAQVEPEEAVFFYVDLGSNACDSALAIHRELLRRDTHLTLYWGVDDHSVQVPPGGVPIVKHSTQWYEKLAAARFLVNNYGGIDGYAPREHQRYLQTWHGTPYKYVGRSQVEHQRMSAEEATVRRAEGGHWHAMISPSPYFTDLVPREFSYDGTVLETGYPRNDALVDTTLDERLRLREELGIPQDKKVLLYAPTFRDLNREGWTASLFTGLDLSALTRHLGDDWVVLLRGHSFNARHDLSDRSTAQVIDVTHHHDINHLYLSADALLTDYSSAMFDFCLTGRPILYFVPDFAQYVRARGVYFDLEPIAPGPWCSTQPQLFAALDALESYDQEYGARYASFKERFAPWDDGKAARRVVDQFFLD